MGQAGLSEMQLDALREVGSIGAGHAATALSQLVDHKIELGVPELEALPVTQIPGVFGGPEQLVAAVYNQVLGDIAGSSLFLIDRASALALVDMLRGHTDSKTVSFGPDEVAVVMNTASILISAYLAAIGRLADLNILPGKPAYAFDMVGAILESVAADVGLRVDEAVIIKTEFSSDDFDVETAVVIDAYLLFMPDEASLHTILGRLGV